MEFFFFFTDLANNGWLSRQKVNISGQEKSLWELLPSMTNECPDWHWALSNISY